MDMQFLKDIKELKHFTSFGASKELIEYALKTSKNHKIIPRYK